MHDLFLMTVAPWRDRRSPGTRGPVARELIPDLQRVLAPWPAALARLRLHIADNRGMVIVEQLPTDGVIAVMRRACRGDDWAVGLYLSPPLEPRFVAAKVIRDAKRTQCGVALRVHPQRTTTRPGERALLDLDPQAAVRALATTFAMYATLLRQRSPTCWAALDAVATHRTATAAAASLGCSQQAVSAQLKRSNRDAVAWVADAIDTIVSSWPQTLATQPLDLVEPPG